MRSLSLQTSFVFPRGGMLPDVRVVASRTLQISFVCRLFLKQICILPLPCRAVRACAGSSVFSKQVGHWAVTWATVFSGLRLLLLAPG